MWLYASIDNKNSWFLALHTYGRSDISGAIYTACLYVF